MACLESPIISATCSCEYGAFRGLFRIIYSIRQNRKDNLQTKGTILSDVLVFLTKVVSLALVVLQFVKAFQQGIS